MAVAEATGCGRRSASSSSQASLYAGPMSWTPSAAGEPTVEPGEGTLMAGRPIVARHIAHIPVPQSLSPSVPCPSQHPRRSMRTPWARSDASSPTREAGRDSEGVCEKGRHGVRQSRRSGPVALGRCRKCGRRWRRRRQNGVHVLKGGGKVVEDLAAHTLRLHKVAVVVPDVLSRETMFWNAVSVLGTFPGGPVSAQTRTALTMRRCP